MKYLTVSEHEGKLYLGTREWSGTEESLHTYLSEQGWKRVVPWGKVTGQYARSANDEWLHEPGRRAA